MGESTLEREFDKYIRLFHLLPPEKEVRFDHDRRFRFDRAYTAHRLAIELEGGVYSGGRHTRGAGFERDCEKYNLAVLRGWRVLRFTGSMLRKDPAGCMTQIEEALSGVTE